VEDDTDYSAHYTLALGVGLLPIPLLVPQDHPRISLLQVAEDGKALQLLQ
jgi:hypothetical protein